MSRLLWLTTADARGHLMRAQQMCRELSARGHEVKVLTTSREGMRFLRAFGIDAELLSEHYRMEFDERQNMARVRTDLRLVRYYLLPTRCLRDLRRLARLADGVELIVNDSFHPALLLVPWLGRRWPAVAHVYGQSLRAAFEGHYRTRLPPWIAERFAAGVAGMIDRASARIEHGVDVSTRVSRGRTVVLPSLGALPSRSAAEVRRALGLTGAQRLAAVYLNPHFRDPRVAEAIEAALAERGIALHGVGEGYAARPGWRAIDTELADVIGAADLLVSAPGLGTLSQVRALGIPFVALATDQPEQATNLAALPSLGAPFEIVRVSQPSFASDLAQAVARVLEQKAHARAAGRSAVGAWASAIEALLPEQVTVRSNEKARSWRTA